MNKTKLTLITFASVFQKHEESAIRSIHSELFDALDNNFLPNVVFAEDFVATEEDGITVIFIATGGTEGMVVRTYDKLPKPLVLLTDGQANSLAASLELACWVRQQKEHCEIIHGEISDIVNKLSKLGNKCNTILTGKRIGVIGEPSDWLISSGVDFEAARQRWGVEYVCVPLSKVEEYFAEDTDEDEASVCNFEKNAMACVEPTRKNIVEAMRMYRVLKRIANEERLNALTLQCFSLIPSTHTTGCLALALLNDEGIAAGCEGDLQSIFTMLLAKEVTGMDGFMANPARINVEENSIIFAHCTIGLRQTKAYSIRSHFESKSGVAIQGFLPEGDVTIVKCGGKALEEDVILTGRIVENQDDPNKCRTQILVKLDDKSDVGYFLDRSIGNHHIILQGNHRKTLSQILDDRL